MDKPQVLLVDDNVETCTLVTALLRRDFRVETAFDGREAIEQLKSKTYAAILLDLRMPQVDGFGVLDHLRSHNPAAIRSVIVLTAALSKNEVSRVAGYEVCAVVAKPFDIEALLAVVKQCARPGGGMTNVRLLSSGVILLLADLLQQRLL
ncbi:MAG: response regulator [Acidobacteriota bacterium]